MGMWTCRLGRAEPRGKVPPYGSKELSPRKAAKLRWGSFKRRFQPTKTDAETEDEWERRGAQLERRVHRSSMPRRENSIFNGSRWMMEVQGIDGRSGAISDRYTGNVGNRSGKIEHSGRIFRSDRLEYQREEIRSKLLSSGGRYGEESPREEGYCHRWMEREVEGSGEMQSQGVPRGSNAGHTGATKGRYGEESPREEEYYYKWTEREAEGSGKISGESEEEESQGMPRGSNAGHSGATKGWAKGLERMRKHDNVGNSFAREEEGNSMQGSGIDSRRWGDTSQGQKLYQKGQTKYSVQRQGRGDFRKQGRSTGEREQEFSNRMERNGDVRCWDEGSSDDVRRRGHVASQAKEADVRPWDEDNCDDVRGRDQLSDSVSHVTSRDKEADVRSWGEISEDDVSGRGQGSDTMSQEDHYDVRNQDQTEDSFRYKENNGHGMDSSDAESAFGISGRRNQRATRCSGSGWKSRRKGDSLSPLMESARDDPGNSKRRERGSTQRSPKVQGLQGRREYSFKKQRGEVRFPATKKKVGSPKKVTHSMGFLFSGSKGTEQAGKAGLREESIREERRRKEGIWQREKNRQHEAVAETGGVPGREGLASLDVEKESELHSSSSTSDSEKDTGEKGKGKKDGVNKQQDSQVGTKAEFSIMMLTAMLGMAGTTFDNNLQSKDQGKRGEGGEKEGKVRDKGEGRREGKAEGRKEGKDRERVEGRKDGKGEDRDRSNVVSARTIAIRQDERHFKRRPATSNGFETPGGQGRNSRLSSRIGSGRIRQQGIKTGHGGDESKRRPATSNGSQRLSGIGRSARQEQGSRVKPKSLFQMPEKFSLPTIGVLVENMEGEDMQKENLQKEDAIYPDDSASVAGNRSKVSGFPRKAGFDSQSSQATQTRNSAVHPDDSSSVTGHRYRMPDNTIRERKAGFDSHGRKATPSGRRMPASSDGRSRVHPMPEDTKTEQPRETEARSSRRPTTAPGISSHHYQGRTKTRGVSQQATPKRDRIDQLHSEMSQANSFLDGLISMLGSASIRDGENSSRRS